MGAFVFVCSLTEYVKYIIFFQTEDTKETLLIHFDILKVSKLSGGQHIIQLQREDQIFCKSILFIFILEN